MAFFSIENVHIGGMVWPERIDITTESGYELKEPCASYNCDFDGKKIDIERGNTCLGGEYSVKSNS